jgi:TolB-like protein
MSNDERRPTIFLSYAHADKTRAQRLAAALEEAGYTVWWDALIEGGSRFASSIDEALDAADAVIVLWSKNSIESDWVRDEATQARDRNRLVPVSLDNCRAPMGFRQYQMIDMTRWHGRADSPQFEAIRRAIAIAAGHTPTPHRRTAPQVDRRRALMIGGAAATVTAGGGLVVWKAGLLGGSSAPARSVAVLPFKNLSGDAQQAFLSDGLTEEIRAALARNAGLLVLAGVSSDTERDHKGDARSISSRLGVAYLLDGSVQRVGDRVRVATNLTNGRTGFSEWSERTERRLDDIFSLQSDIALKVSRALSVQMATDAPALGGTRNARAYEAYLRGKTLYNLARDASTDREARTNFEVAVADDPEFALAHAALSRVLASIASQSAQASDLKLLYSSAVEQAERAIEIAPGLAEGHLALAYARFAGFLDIRGAQPSYEKAYELGRGNADVVLLYALYAVRARRYAAARDAIERALALDPLNPRTHRAAGTVAYASRRYADAVTEYRRALQLNPKISIARAFMGDALLQMGKLDEAREAYAAETAPMFRLRGLAIVEHRAGNRAAAERAFNALVSEIGDAAMYQQAEVMAQWGRTDDALARLQRAREIGDSGLSYVATDPLLDPIAKDPRFLRFIRDLGFT